MDLLPSTTLACSLRTVFNAPIVLIAQVCWANMQCKFIGENSLCSKHIEMMDKIQKYEKEYQEIQLTYTEKFISYCARHGRETFLLLSVFFLI